MTNPYLFSHDYINMNSNKKGNNKIKNDKKKGGEGEPQEKTQEQQNPIKKSSMLSSLSANAQHLGSWLLPKSNSNGTTQRNEVRIHFLWYPHEARRYRKGSSVGDTERKYGDLMVYIEPEEFADASQYITHSFESVDDLLANVLNGCKDMTCSKGNVTPIPIQRNIYKITDYQPDIDLKAQLAKYNTNM